MTRLRSETNGSRARSAPGSFRAVVLAGRILGECVSLSEEFGVNDLARRFKVGKSTVWAVLNSLVQTGLLEHGADQQKYRMGIGLVRMASLLLGSPSMAQLHCLGELRNATGETAALHVRAGDFRLCVGMAESAAELRMTAPVGVPLPLYAGASGKVLLAFSPPGLLERYLRNTKVVAFTAQTPDARRLRDELKHIREQGYAVSAGERLLGAASVYAPILDERREAVAAIGVLGPVARMDKDRISKIVDVVRRTARRVSKTLEHADV